MAFVFTATTHLLRRMVFSLTFGNTPTRWLPPSRFRSWLSLAKALMRSTPTIRPTPRSEEHTSELQSRLHLVCRLLLEKKKNKSHTIYNQRTNSAFYDMPRWQSTAYQITPELYLRCITLHSQADPI